MIVSSVVVVGLIIAAVLVGRRWRSVARSERPAPRLIVVGGVMIIVAGLHSFAAETWIGVAMILAAAGAAVAVIATWSRRSGWSPAHVAVTAAAPLIMTAALAFTYYPMIGTVTATEKYGHNIAMLTIVVIMTLLAVRPRRGRPADQPPREDRSQELRTTEV